MHKSNFADALPDISPLTQPGYIAEPSAEHGLNWRRLLIMATGRGKCQKAPSRVRPHLLVFPEIEFALGGRFTACLAPIRMFFQSSRPGVCADA